MVLANDAPRLFCGRAASTLLGEATAEPVEHIASNLKFMTKSSHLFAVFSRKSNDYILLKAYSTLLTLKLIQGLLYSSALQDAHQTSKIMQN